MKEAFDVQSRYRGDAEKMREQVRALEVLEGYPLRPTFVGAGCAALIGAEPTFGMTTALAEVSEDGGDATVDIPSDLVLKHAGKVALVDGKEVAIDIGERVREPVDPREPGPVDKRPTGKGGDKR